ncbi:TPA: L-lactate dehydrogenase, partial [bacterium]|nr:L-lactate dehydrogenase [bacterium]
MKVIIVGCGNVGMSYAYTLVNQPSRVDELVLIDVNHDKAIGEALDLSHALPFAPSKIRIKAGNYEDCNDADIICITAGANQNKGETRLDLV